MPQERDNCQVCKGEHGGEPGNENRVGEVVLCDYCHAATIGASELNRTAREALSRGDREALLLLVQQYRAAGTK